MAKQKVNQDIQWPSGGYEWTPEQLSRLPTMRHIHVNLRNHLFTNPIEFKEPDQYGYRASDMSSLSSQLNENWTLWDAATAKKKTTTSALLASNETQWLEIFLQALVRGVVTEHKSVGYNGPDWAAKSCSDTKGILHAVKTVLKLYDFGYAAILANNEHYLYNHSHQYEEPLRCEIAQCNEEDHTELIEFLDNYDSADPDFPRFRSYIAPHIDKWLTYDSKTKRTGIYLNNTTSAEKLLSIAKTNTGKKEGFIHLETLLLQIKLHGEVAFDLLQNELQQHYTKKHAANITDLIVNMRAPRTIEVLASCIDNVEAKSALETLAKQYPAATLKCMIDSLVQNSSPISQAWTLRLAHNNPDVLEQAISAANEPAAKHMKSVLNSLQTATTPVKSVPKNLKIADSKKSRLPEFYNAALLQKPVLNASKKALPEESIYAIGHILQDADTLNNDLDEIKTQCTPESLANFAWSLFEAWMSDNAPHKHIWAFNALGYFGNSETADKIAPLIRIWPGRSQHKRAALGLDVLANIGTDSALMQLNLIATKLKYKALREQADKKIKIIAASRGLSGEQLADRLTPDMDLDSRGQLQLDFGPRQFLISFDESLKPIVFDSSGTRLKDLPKPRKTDDKDIASNACKQFKKLKKDVRTVATTQLTRLENAMILRRRWTLSEATLFFLNHPLMCHFSRRLVWGIYDSNNALVDTFRVAEDNTLTNANDEQITVPDNSTVGLPHPLEMSEKIKAQYGELLANYECIQPFPQLIRETHTLKKEEIRTGDIAQFNGRNISSGALLALMKSGWDRGYVGDGGGINEMTLTIKNRIDAEIKFEPGMIAGNPSVDPVQTITQLTVAIKNADPVFISEMIRDVSNLKPIKG